MGMKHTTGLLKTVFAFLVITTFTSCFVSKRYHRPENIIDDKLFRIESKSNDTTNIASTEWKKLFTDDILQLYIQRTLDNNLDLQIALQNLKAAESLLKQSRLMFTPSLTLQPTTQFQILSMNTPQGATQGENHISGYLYSMPGSFSWEADIWGKINSRKKAALASYLSTQAAHQAIRSQLIAIIASSYYQLIAYDAQKEILNETIQSRQQSLETNKALKDAGILTEVAVKQAEAQWLNAKAQMVSIENTIRMLENAMCLLMAQDPQPLQRNKLSAQQINTPLSFGVPYQILSNRPDVFAAEYNLMSAFEMTNVARASFYPSLMLTATGGLQSIDIDKLFSIQSLFANVIASLTQPLWNQRKIHSQYKISLAQQQVAYLNYRKTILTAGNEVSNALYNYQTQDQLYSLKYNEFIALDTAMKYSQDLLKYGMASYLDVLTAQQNALNAQLSYINASYGRLAAIIELYRSLGGGR